MSTIYPTHGDQFNADDAAKGLLSAADRLPSLTKAGTGLLIRVSSAMQRKNLGSIKFQMEQERHLASYGAGCDHIRLYDARAESAKPGADRPVFRQLLEDVRRGEVRVVLVSDADRVARNDPDSEALYNLLSESGGLLLINGEISDPSNLNHRLVLRLKAAIAQYEIEQKALRSLTGKAAKARGLSLRIPLAVGQVWASPDDEEFRRRMVEAGMAELLSPEHLARHQTRVKKEGRRYYVFPYPDAEVADACRLTIQWLLEAGNVDAVVERIANDPAWPRPGMFPAIGGRLFDASEIVTETPDEDATVPEDGRKVQPKWKLLIDPDDARPDRAYVAIYGWLRGNSIYGAYHARFPALKKLSAFAARLGSRVQVNDAYPAYASAADRTRVLELLSGPDRQPIFAKRDGPRNNVLSTVRCSHPMPRGETCGAKMVAVFPTALNGRHHYSNVVCYRRKHRFALPGKVDAIVIGVLTEVFTEQRLRAELDRIRVDGGASKERVQRIETQIRELESQAKWENRCAHQASAKGDETGMRFHEAERDEVLKELGLRRQERDQALRLSESVGRITEKEYNHILQLASDLPELIRRAAPIEGRVRRIAREFIQCVHARPVGWGVFHLRVVFRSGESITRVVHTAKTDVPQPVRALARERLKPWLDPADRATAEAEQGATEAAKALAKELNSLMKGASVRTLHKSRLFGAALTQDSPDERPRRGAHEAVDALAERLCLEHDQVLRAALKGLLGPAVGRNGGIALRPTTAEVHRAFRNVAVRDVASEKGWPMEDVVSLAELERETRWDRCVVNRYADAGAGIAADAADRKYTRRSMFRLPTKEDLEEQLRAALPVGADAENGEWMTYADAARRVPNVGMATWERHTSVVRPGHGPSGRRTVYVWLDPAVEQMVRRPTLAQAVAALGIPGLSPEDFHLRAQVLASFAERFGGPGPKAWRRAVTSGHVLQVFAKVDRRGYLKAYGYVPREVLETDDIDVVQRFLRGEFTHRTRGVATPQ